MFTVQKAIAICLHDLAFLILESNKIILNLEYLVDLVPVVDYSLLIGKLIIGPYDSHFSS